MRYLSDDFVFDLTSGMLSELLQEVKQDATICMEIRESFINIYYRGGNLLKIVENKGWYDSEFDINYLQLQRPDYLAEKKLQIPPQIHTRADVDTWIEMFPILKRQMDIWLGKQPKNEREFQQLLVRENNFCSAAPSTDYFICDIEYANRDGRFDMIAVNWPSQGHIRKNPCERGLAFIEMKYLDKSLTGESGITGHVKSMNRYLSHNSLDDIKVEMLYMFNLKRSLGLIVNQKDLCSFNKNKPEYIFIFANHDPAKSALQRELSEVLKTDECRSLEEIVDIKVAVSNFMGYGLYQECIYPVRSFMDKFLG